MVKSIKAKTWQDKYYDCESEYANEKYVCSYLLEGLDDCLDYSNYWLQIHKEELDSLKNHKIKKNK
ncbi:hypothetical protein BSK59_13055 [Paenibacillus odorifer]|uniref:hypothetical protein n=1 Tax=Paenibacillus odorifer TaxID=189426 RepID=UPI00096E80D0|nr:hypothetical protein [Paenibacillus odorifer]OME55401.1 hypothetical protein BSK59_13055 [Paenibacillus odorifer]